MKIIKLGWQHLRLSERITFLASIVLAISLAYIAIRDGYGIISNQGLGPLILMWLACYSVISIGIIRMRSFALNYVFVETLKKLHDAEKGISKEVSELIAGFLGDKK